MSPAVKLSELVLTLAQDNPDIDTCLAFDTCMLHDMLMLSSFSAAGRSFECVREGYTFTGLAIGLLCIVTEPQRLAWPMASMQPGSRVLDIARTSIYELHCQICSISTKEERIECPNKYVEIILTPLSWSVLPLSKRPCMQAVRIPVAWRVSAWDDMRYQGGPATSTAACFWTLHSYCGAAKRHICQQCGQQLLGAACSPHAPYCEGGGMTLTARKTLSGKRTVAQRQHRNWRCLFLHNCRRRISSAAIIGGQGVLHALQQWSMMCRHLAGQICSPIRITAHSAACIMHPD